MKKSYHLLAILLLITVFLTSCNQPAEKLEDPSGSQLQETEPATDAPLVDPETVVTGNVSEFTYYEKTGLTPPEEALLEPAIYTFGSYAQWEAFRAEYYSRWRFSYGEDYFDSKSLAVCFFSETSTSNQLIIQNVQVKDGELLMTIGRHVPQVDFTEEKIRCFFVELDGDVVLHERSKVVVEFVEIENLDPSTDPNTAVTGSVNRFSCMDATRYTTSVAYGSKPEIYAIGSYDQWRAFCYLYYPQLLNQYESDYFSTHSVVLYRKYEPSCTIDVCVREVEVRDGKLVVSIGRYVPESQEQEMKDWCILIEIEGNVVIDEYDDATVEFYDQDHPLIEEDRI